MKIFLKKRLTFLEDKFILCGLSKLGRKEMRNLTSGTRKKSASL